MAVKETTLFVRNRRPNRVAFTASGVRYVLERRGHREDSTSLPIEAKSEPLVARWLKNGQLEEISRESFNKLAARTVDQEPRFFLKATRNKKGAPLNPADGDATRSLTTIFDKDVHSAANPTLEWAGELMTTEEELETMEFEQQQGNYPSRHRGEDTRAMGY